SATINIVLGRSFIKIWGLYGGVGALSLSFAVLMIIRLVQLNRKFEIQMNIKDIMTVAFLILSIPVFYYNKFFLIDLLSIIILGGIYLFNIRDYIKIVIKARNKFDC